MKKNKKDTEFLNKALRKLIPMCYDINNAYGYKWALHNKKKARRVLREFAKKYARKYK